MAICVSTTRMPAHLLRIVLRHRGLSPNLLCIHYAWPERPRGVDDRIPPTDQDVASPSMMVLQQGGLTALRNVGLNVQDMIRHGWTADRCTLLDAKTHVLCEFEAAAAAAAWPPVWISTQWLRQWLAAHTDDRSGTPTASDRPANSCCWHARDDCRDTWTTVACPGILLRTMRGRLCQPHTQMLWDHPAAHVGLVHAASDRVLLYAIPKRVAETDVERDTCLRVLDEAPRTLTRYIQEHGEVLEDQWFALDTLGYRPCWNGDLLRWGPTTLRLHPLTGQWLSYWAIHANRVADELARHGELTATFRRHLDQHNRRMFHLHLRSLQYHLQTTPIWKLFHHPYAWLLRHSTVLRHRTIRRAALS